MQTSPLKLKSGFTLIEILIVIAIIGLLMAVFVPNFNELRRKSRDQARKSSIKAIAEALELYKINHVPPAYPASLSSITPEEPWIEDTVTYMNQFPKDPLYHSSPTEYFYRYQRDGSDPLKYYLGACLEDKTDSDGKSVAGMPLPWTTVFDENTCPSKRWYYKIEP